MMKRFVHTPEKIVCTTGCSQAHQRLEYGTVYSLLRPTRRDSNHEGRPLRAVAYPGTQVYHPGVPKSFAAIAQQARRWAATWSLRMKSADTAPRGRAPPALLVLLRGSADGRHDGISRDDRSRHPGSRRVVRGRCFTTLQCRKLGTSPFSNPNRRKSPTRSVPPRSAPDDRFYETGDHRPVLPCRKLQLWRPGEPQSIGLFRETRLRISSKPSSQGRLPVWMMRFAPDRTSQLFDPTCKLLQGHFPLSFGESLRNRMFDCGREQKT